MRNRVVHAYFGIDRDIVWRTVQVELPKLLTDMQMVLERK